MDVLLSVNATKQLNRLTRQDKAKVIKKLAALRLNSHLGKFLSGELTGVYSLRAWPYRILYTISPDQKIIKVHRIAHRKDVYR